MTIVNYIGPGAVILYWEAEDLTGVIVPDDNFAYVVDVGNSPYQVDIQCPSGYSFEGSRCVEMQYTAFIESIPIIAFCILGVAFFISILSF